LSVFLLPLTGLFCAVTALRRLLYRIGWLRTHTLGVPVIIVGNITVGGTGKTPMVVWLAEKLSEQGYRPGIITRGYGGQSKQWPCEVKEQSSAKQVGDEAILLKRRTHCPVYAGPDRPLTAKRLLSEHPCNLIISDDGLQHYALDRNLEIVVIDGARRFGNGYCLPAGPLRESPKRLPQMDLVIINGQAGPGEYQMCVKGEVAVALKGGEVKALTSFVGASLHAIAGIGRPERFFAMLEAAGLKLKRHPFPDHHRYCADDLKPFASQTVLMTEKDGVKCELFAQPDHWYVPATAIVDPGFEKQLMVMIKRLTDGQKTA
jgi:tetraacyldisaccharide 4'-kinase